MCNRRFPQTPVVEAEAEVEVEAGAWRSWAGIAAVIGTGLSPVSHGIEAGNRR